MDSYLEALKRGIAVGLGCTEPIAVALATTRAREALGRIPDTIRLHVSRNILKNAMGVGIPGTGMQGLEIAAALAVVCGRSSYGLEVLKDSIPEDVVRANELVGSVSVDIAQSDKTLYVRAELSARIENPENDAPMDIAECVIENSHANITRVTLNGRELPNGAPDADKPSGLPVVTEAPDTISLDFMTVEGIYEFINTVSPDKLAFMHDSLRINLAIAEEGMRGGFGMRVGQRLCRSSPQSADDALDDPIALTAAAVDARMGGCVLPVMTLAGSGNQGLTATIPVASVARRQDASDEKLLRALALSHLITIHVKDRIGILSALCGGANAASMGAACAIAYLMGGGQQEIIHAAQNMTADVAGLICDGAKAGCALKIATGVSAALQCAKLAMAGVAASDRDGIVSSDIERSINNLGELGVRGMEATDKVILEMMLCK